MFYALSAYSAVKARQYRKKYEAWIHKASLELVPFYAKAAAEYRASEIEAKCTITHTELYLWRTQALSEAFLGGPIG